MRGSVVTGYHGYLIGRDIPLLSKRESIVELSNPGDLVINLDKLFLKEETFSSLFTKQALFPKIFLPVQIEKTGISREFRIRTSKGNFNLKMVFDNLAQNPKALSSTDVKALFSAFLYGYAELENIAMFDIQPSLDRVFVHDGKIKFSSPLASPTFVENYCKVT